MQLADIQLGLIQFLHWILPDPQTAMSVTCYDKEFIFHGRRWLKSQFREGIRAKRTENRLIGGLSYIQQPEPGK